MKYNKPLKHHAAAGQEIAHGVRIYSDGVVEARGFRDVSIEGLEFDEIRDKGVKFHRAIDEETSVEFIPRSVKVYRSTVKRSFSIKNAFAVIKGKVKKFILDRLPRFKHSSKRLKNEINKIKKEKSTWTFTQNRNGEHWGQVYIDSTTFGPYNYDVKVKAATDLSFINDIIAIKTGGFDTAFQPTEETIVYLSPHDTLRYEGDFQYITTGETIYKNVIQDTAVITEEEGELASFSVRDLGVTNSATAYVPTSNMIFIPSGEFLSHGHGYTYHDDEVAYSDTNDVLLPDTVVGMVYDEYSEKLKTTAWDGIIPSGVWFRVENWAFQSENLGHAGTLEIVPTDSSIECSYEGTFEASATDEKHMESRNKAEKKAAKAFHRSLNGYLVNKGVKNKNSKTLKYEAMQKRVAQNVYDGLDNRRKKRIDVTDESKWTYYEGTSPEYGGSEKESNFNYENIAVQKMKDGRMYGSAAIGVTPVGEEGEVSRTSEGGGTWSYNSETESWEPNENTGGSY